MLIGVEIADSDAAKSGGAKFSSFRKLVYSGPGDTMNYQKRIIRIGVAALAVMTFAAIDAASAATPTTQKAVVQTGNGGPEVLQYQTIPVLEPAAGQVLIRVAAASVNPGDWKMRTGLIREESGGSLGALPGGLPTGGLFGDGPSVPGGDVAGVIEKLGPGVTGFKVGEPVLAISDPLSAPVAGLNGGYSQYVVAPVSGVAKKPERLSYVEAAGLGMTGTMAARLISRTKVSKGQRVLITGAGGGIGSLAVQLAELRGAQVIGIASGGHAGFLKSLGVDEHIDYTQGEWTAKAKNIDVAIDTVAGATAASAFATVKKGGVFISVLPNPAVTPEKCAAAGVVCVSSQGDGSGQYLPQLVQLAGDGKLKIRIGKTFPLAEAGQAQETNRAGRTEGKIVLVVDETLVDKK